MYRGPELALHTREAIRKQAPEGLVMLPVGAIEQHGPHLPICTDAEIAKRLCLHASESCKHKGRVFVAPTLPYGISYHHIPHPGVMTVGPETYLALLCDLTTSLAESGFRRIVLVNAHGGNREAVGMAIRKVNYTHNVTVFGVNVAQLPLGELNIPYGHAGEFETALMKYLTPESVSNEMPEDRHSQRVYINGQRLQLAGGRSGVTPGYTDSPSRATQENGKAIFDVLYKELASVCDQVFDAHKANEA